MYSNDSKFVNSLFWLDNDLETESKCHCYKMLGLQDVINIRIMFFPKL